MPLILLFLACLSLSWVTVRVWRTRRSRELRLYSLLALLGVFIALPGGAIVGLAATDGTAPLGAIALAWVTCAVILIELATWGRPLLLSRWLELFLEKRTLSPVGDEKAELQRLKRITRPYSKRFVLWCVLLPLGAVASIAAGYATGADTGMELLG